MTPIKTAIIGLGHLGSKHLRVCSELPEAKVTTICDMQADKGEPLAEKFGVSFVSDYKSITDIDAVHICTPTRTHFEIATYFLNKGIHTFIEKPISTTVQEADALVALAAEKNVKLQVGHVERFNSAFQSIKDIARNPVFVECHRLNNFPNRSLDIGVIMDLMIHDIDIVCGLIDSEVKDIQAVGINVLTDMDDIANARLTFANGSVCNLTASRVSPEVMRKIRLFLPNTYISLDYVKQEAFMYRKEGGQIDKTALPIEVKEPLKKENQDFFASIKENRKPLVSGEEGRNALAVALRIMELIPLENQPARQPAESPKPFSTAS